MTYTLALGTLLPHWCGPQRLVLTIEGDTVRDVTYTGGFNERGCAERIPRLPLDAAVHLVSRISSVGSHAHTLAFCMALEQLVGVEAPPRAQWLRCAFAELERLQVHLHSLTELATALGAMRYSDPLHACHHTARRAMHELCGRATMPDQCVPGGIRDDLEDAPRRQALLVLEGLQRQFFPLVDRMVDAPALLARTINTGVIGRDVAERFLLRGPLARAAGIEADTRIDAPYAAYAALEVRRVTQEGGDTHARMVLLLLEALECIRLSSAILHDLPDGAAKIPFPRDIPAAQATTQVEAPRGMLRYTVQGNGQRIGGVIIDAPRTLDRLLARTLLGGLQLDNVLPVLHSLQACAADAEG